MAGGSAPSADRSESEVGADLVERVVLAAGLGFAAFVVVGLLAHYLPGAMTPGRLLLVADAFVAVLAVAVWRLGVTLDTSVPRRQIALHVAVLLVAAAALRLPAIGYAEFQGDEATILLKAAAAVGGRSDALFIHKKGPAEIVVPAVLYGLAGTATEGAARLPFAVAMCAGLLAVYQLGRTLFGSNVALAGALILAANGFYVGFGRIVQYQSLVFLFSVLAVLAAVRTRRGERPRAHVALSVLFMAVGVLAHYDALFAALPVCYLWWRRWRADPRTLRGDATAAAATAAAGAAVLAAFYVPTVRHPFFREATLPYLFGVRLGGGGGPLHNSLDNSLALATFYNSTYYMAFLAATLLSLVALWLVRSWPGRRGWALAIGAVGAVVMLFVGTAVLPEGGAWLALPILLAVVVLVMAGGAPSEAEKAIFLWLGGSFVVYATLVASPRTHFHVVFPAWSLLSAVALGHGARRLPSPSFRTAAVAVGAALLAIFLAYDWAMFVQHDVEYRRVFPARQPVGFWMPIRQLPSSGWFGFPYRAGWKAIGDLYEAGVLQGTYGSNEEENVTDWYTRGAPRCNTAPRYFVIADEVQDQRPTPSDLAAEGYREILRVRDGSRTRLRVYERAASAPGGAVRTVELADHAASFDRQAGPRFEPNLPYAEDLGGMDTPGAADFGGLARLESWALDSPVVTPGGELVAALYWRGTAPMDKDYSVYAHLSPAGGGAGTVAQSDGAPGLCGDEKPTTTWQPGRIVVDRRVLAVPAGTPEGEYVVRIGLYDYETLERLPVLAPGGQAVDDGVDVGVVRVEAAGR